MKYEVTNIVYDTDGEDIKLPTRLILESDEEEPDFELADMISDTTGFCVISFNFNKIM